MRLFVLMAAVLLTGCATTDQLASNSQLYSGHSMKAREDVSGCISRTWRRSFGFITRTVPADDHNAVILSTGNYHSVDMIAYVYDGGHTEIQERRTSWGFLDDDLKHAAMQCL